MARRLKVVDSQLELPLAELARKINEEYEAAKAAIGVAANHALMIGEMLVEAQTRVQTAGLNWEEWVEANLPFGQRQASSYLRVSKSALLNRKRASDSTDAEALNTASLRAGLRTLLPPPEKPKEAPPSRPRTTTKAQEPLEPFVSKDSAIDPVIQCGMHIHMATRQTMRLITSDRWPELIDEIRVQLSDLERMMESNRS